MAILIIVFLFTWAPYEICAFVHPVCKFCIPNFTLEVVFWLLWLNSTINPMLYPFLQQRLITAIPSIWMDDEPSLKGAWSGSLDARGPNDVSAEASYFVDS